MSSASVWARRTAVLLSVLAGGVVVALSWMAPEPPSRDSAPPQRIAPMTYEQCVRQAPPNYGTRSLTSPMVNC